MSEEFAGPASRVSARRAAINADQVEYAAIQTGAAPVADCLIDDTIAYDRLPEEYETATNPLGNAEWAEEDDARETAVGETITEIERRRILLGEHYPFDISSDKQLVTHAPARDASRVYEFCLALSTTRRDLTANPACRAVREVERLGGKLLKGFM